MENTPSEDTAAQEKALARIRELLAENDELRKKRILIVRGALLLILIAIGIFIYNLAIFTKNYDKEALFKETATIMKTVSETSEFKKLQATAEKKALPVFMKEFKKQFKAEFPKFQKQGVQAAGNLEVYLVNDVKQKLLGELSGAIHKMEKDVLKKYPDLDTEKMEIALKDVESHFVENMTESLNQRVDKVKKELDDLYNSFDQFKGDPEYKKLSPEHVPEVESKLIETALELCIYQVNPKKGKMPSALPEGGVK